MADVGSCHPRTATATTATTTSSYGVFPFGQVPNMGPDSGFNPFRNTSPTISGFTEILKTILCLPLFLIRLVVFAILFLIGFVWMSAALFGAEDVLTRPFPTWRRRMMWPVRICARGLLFCLGYHWIHVKGRPAPRDVAPIVVGNHVAGLIDGIFVFYHLLPVIVSARENLDYPVCGTILRALQIISVERLKPSSRKDCLAEIKRRALCNDWPHVMMFPEATTTNGKALVSFKTGAFVPGMPVQPMVLKYPHVKFDPCWVVEGPGIVMLLFRMMTQVVNFMEVEYLPVVVPTSKEKRNPVAFAERTRLLMARALNVVCTEHTYGDVALAMNAARLKTPSHSAMVEFGRMEKLFRLDLATAKEYLEKFMAMDISKSGKLTMDEFLQALELPDTDLTRRVFFLFDRNERGYINFREFLAGLAFISKHTSFSKSIEAAFRACDTNGDGLLSRQDVERSVRTVFPAILDGQLARLFDLLDMDRDGQIKWQEFKRFLEKHPEYLAVIMTARPDLLAKPESESLLGEPGAIYSASKENGEEEDSAGAVVDADPYGCGRPRNTPPEANARDDGKGLGKRVAASDASGASTPVPGPKSSSVRKGDLNANDEGMESTEGGSLVNRITAGSARTSVDDSSRWSAIPAGELLDQFDRNSLFVEPTALDTAAAWASA